MRKASWVLALAPLLVAAPLQARPCTALTDDEARLACYDRLAECVTNHDPAARLACYDAAEPQLAGEAAAPAERAGGAGGTAAPARDADEVFPLRRAAPEDEDEADERVVAEVVAVQTDPRGLHYLTLDNGQVWRELSKSRLRFEAGDEVELSRGVLGSVNLRVNGRTGYIKVRRVE